MKTIAAIAVALASGCAKSASGPIGPAPGPGPLATLTVAANRDTIVVFDTVRFTAVGKDAVGNIVPITPTWTVVTGDGTIDSTSGFFGATDSPGAPPVVDPATEPPKTSTIRATSGGIIGAATVTKIELAKITVTPSLDTLLFSATRQFTAVGQDGQGHIRAFTPTWSVSSRVWGKGPGTVSSSGLYTAPSSTGTDWVVANGGRIGGSVVVTVIGPATGKLTKIEVWYANPTLTIGAKTQFHAVGLDAYGDAVAITPKWSIVNGGGAIDNLGMFTADSVIGTYSNTIKAASGDVAGYASANVTGCPCIIDLGTPGALSVAWAINSSGQVVGNDGHAFLWESGTKTDLGNWDARAIDSAGRVVGTSGGRAVLWERGVLTDLGTLGGVASEAHWISNAGDVLGTSKTVNGDSHAFFWHRGAMTDLGTLGGTSTIPTGLNSAGQVVGSSQTSNGDLHAFLRQGGVMTDLGTLGGRTSGADAINASGDVVGWAETAATRRHPFLWRQGAMIDLDPSGAWASEAMAINAAGQVAMQAGETTVYLWQDGIMTSCPSRCSTVMALSAAGQVAGEASPDHSYFWDGTKVTQLPGSAITGMNASGWMVGEISVRCCYETHAAVWIR